MAKKIAAKEKIRRFLRERVGQIVTAEEIQEAAGEVTEPKRRLRELRQDEGWKISSHRDRSALKPGQYILEEAPPEGLYKVAKPISQRLRSQVLERNGYTCMMCGIGAGETDETGRKAILHIGHIIDRSHGGKDELSNLRALCNRCNEGAKNLVQEPPSHTWLLAQVRRADADTQRKVQEWLNTKFKTKAEGH